MADRDETKCSGSRLSGDTGGHMQLEQQLWGGNFFHERIRTAIEHKVLAVCGKPRTKNQLGQFRRLVTIH